MHVWRIQRALQVGRESIAEDDLKLGSVSGPLSIEGQVLAAQAKLRQEAPVLRVLQQVLSSAWSEASKALA